MPTPHPHFTIPSLASSDPQAFTRYLVTAAIIISQWCRVFNLFAGVLQVSLKTPLPKNGCCTERACPGSNQACKHTLPNNQLKRRVFCAPETLEPKASLRGTPGATMAKSIFDLRTRV
nr:hypothetical protein Itr_chr03CG08350 [Ipomoea trifida]